MVVVVVVLVLVVVIVVIVLIVVSVKGKHVFPWRHPLAAGRGRQI